VVALKAISLISCDSLGTCSPTSASSSECAAHLPRTLSTTISASSFITRLLTTRLHDSMFRQVSVSVSLMACADADLPADMRHCS
jgi:hypothetical protein